MKKKILLFIFALVMTITGIVNANAADKYDGDYTIEYLLKNYNVVTLGTKERYDYTLMSNYDNTKGSVTNVYDVGGPVLIRGNYSGNLVYDNEFAQKTNGIPSYIKGTLDVSVTPGSVEAADISDIYVGSNNRVTNNGGTYTVNGITYDYKYPVKVSDDYVDFDKLYAAIVNEQATIDEGTKLSITTKAYSDTSHYVTISEPGIYTIDDLEKVHIIFIENYNPDKLYVINTNSKYVHTFPVVSVNFEPEGDAVYCGRTDSNENCTGNIIWSFKNARYIYTNYATRGHIIAPKADIELVESNYPGTIIANSITAETNSYTAIQFYPYNLDETFTDGEGSTTINETKEIDRDLYDGDYSLKELLKNYSVITLGQKDYGSNTKLSTLTNTNGTASIFHIVGQFLINGDLGVATLNYGPPVATGSIDTIGVRLDLRTTDESISSYLKGNLMTKAYDSETKNTYFDSLWKRLWVTNNPSIYVGSGNNIKTWDNSNNWFYNQYNLGSYTDYEQNYHMLLGPKITHANYELETDHAVYQSDNYINFELLYDKIVAQQKLIDEGSKATKNDEGIISIEIGGNYVIDSLDDVKEIRFQNFALNKDRLTIITIKDEGIVNLPKVTRGGAMVFTSDWYNKTLTTYYNEELYYSGYHGNIIWNIPNATYLTLEAEAPFIGHVIAPNADVETPELHFAGAMIVNSLYTEGYSEAHFFPLTTDETITVESIDISGTKTWDDQDNQDGLRPESIIVNLLADGEKVDSVTVTEEDNWEYTFNDVPKLSNDREIVYTITEESVENYATEVDGYDITNSYTPKKTSLTVNKLWDDQDDKDGLRPESVEVQLYANDEKLGEPVELNEDNKWTHIFNELDMNSKGEKIEYTIKEITKINGYTTEITGDPVEGYTITNTHIIEVENIKDNPITLDNIAKFTMISILSSILIVGGIILLTRMKKKGA